MTPSELIKKHKEHNPSSHFFDKATLRFFGETVKNMRVFETSVLNTDGQMVPVYKLRSLQLNAPFRPVYSVHYFDKETFAEVRNVQCEM